MSNKIWVPTANLAGSPLMPTTLSGAVLGDGPTLINGTEYAPFILNGPGPAGTPILGGPAPFALIDLFAASEVGWLIDVRDGQNMWQDEAGTTPVTAAGQSVALVGATGPAGLRRFVQGTAGNRPVYQVDATGGHLVGNGSAFMVQQSPNQNGLPANLSMGVLIEPTGADNVRGTVAGWKISTSNNFCYVEAPAFSASQIGGEVRLGTSTGSIARGVVDSPWSRNHWWLGEWSRDGSNTARRFRLNGAETIDGATASGTNNFTNAPWELFRRPVDNINLGVMKLRVAFALYRTITDAERAAISADLAP
jgi:hypothetical protein